MSDDVSGILDVATTVDSPAPFPSVPDPVDPDPSADTDSETPTDSPADTSEPGDQPEAGAEPDEKPVDGRTNPAAIRSALKAFRDSDPKNGPIARQLNDGFGRYLAYKEQFPKVADAQNARALLDAVGGGDGLASLQATIKSVNDTDAKLYAGDGSVLDDILSDMKKEGKQDAFFKLASPFLDRVLKENPEAYYSTMKPHFLRGLVDVNFPGVVGAALKALSGETPDAASAKNILSQMSDWFEGLRNSVETEDKTKLDPERQAFERERTEFQTAKQKEFQTDVAKTCDSHNNTSLGGALKDYFKLPFFKAFPQNTKVEIARGVKSQLFAELSADKGYQSQMDTFFASKSPDREAIARYHSQKVDSMSKRIVRELLNTRYPNFSKGSAAAGAKAATGPKAVPRPGTPAPQSGTKPVYVPVRPSGEQIDWDKDPDKMLFITGKAFLKGSGKLVAWHPRYKTQ